VHYLCDTNVVSEAMRRSPNRDVLSWFESLETVIISVITVEEIRCGLTCKDACRQSDWFEEFCQIGCDVLPVTEEIATYAGILRSQLRKAGRVHTQADMLIAATAAQHALTLATRNVADFDNCGIPVFNPFPV